MKKLLTAAVLSAMLMAPAAVSAAPQDVNAVVAPEGFEQRYVTEYRTHYGDCNSAPSSIYYSSFDGFTGWLNKISCYDNGGITASVTYTGWVSRFR